MKTVKISLEKIHLKCFFDRTKTRQKINGETEAAKDQKARIVKIMTEITALEQ